MESQGMSEGKTKTFNLHLGKFEMVVEQEESTSKMWADAVEGNQSCHTLTVF